MNTKHMEYFVCLAKEKSFSKASEQLMISQPTLSQAIRKMEQDLGAALFDRSQQVLELTEAGELFLRSSQQILDIIRQTEGRITDLGNGVCGSVNIGVAPWRSPILIPKLIREIKEKYPTLHLNIAEMYADEMMEALSNGELDLAITPSVDDSDQRFTSINLVEETVIIAIGTEQAKKSLGEKADRKKLSIEDFSLLNGVEFVVLTNSLLLGKTFANLVKQTGDSFFPVIECVKLDTAVAIANECGKATLIPSTAADYYGKIHKKLSFYEIEQSTLERKLCVIHRKNQYLSKPAEYVIECLRKEFK